MGIKNLLSTYAEYKQRVHTLEQKKLLALEIKGHCSVIAEKFRSLKDLYPDEKDIDQNGSLILKESHSRYQTYSKEVHGKMASHDAVLAKITNKYNWPSNENIKKIDKDILMLDRIIKGYDDIKKVTLASIKSVEKDSEDIGISPVAPEDDIKHNLIEKLNLLNARVDARPAINRDSVGIMER